MVNNENKNRQTKFISVRTGLAKDFSGSTYWQDLIFNNPDTFGKPFLRQENTGNLEALLKRINDLEKEVEKKEELIKKGEKTVKEVETKIVEAVKANVGILTTQAKTEHILRNVLDELGDTEGADKTVPSVERVQKRLKELLAEKKKLEEELEIEKARPTVVSGGGAEFTQEEKWLFGYTDQAYELIDKVLSTIEKSGGKFGKVGKDKWETDKKNLILSMRGEVDNAKGLGGIGLSYVEAVFSNAGKVRTELEPLFWIILGSLNLVSKVIEDLTNQVIKGSDLQFLYDKLGTNNLTELQRFFSNDRTILDSLEEWEYEVDRTNQTLKEILEKVSSISDPEQVHKIEEASFSIIDNKELDSTIKIAEKMVSDLRPLYFENKLFYAWEAIRELLLTIFEAKDENFDRAGYLKDEKELFAIFQDEEKRKKEQARSDREFENRRKAEKERFNARLEEVKKFVNSVIGRHSVSGLTLSSDRFVLKEVLNEVGIEEFLWNEGENWEQYLNSSSGLADLTNKERELKAILARLVINYYLQRESPVTERREGTIGEMIITPNLKEIQLYMEEHNSEVERTVYGSFREAIAKYQEKTETIKAISTQIVTKFLSKVTDEVVADEAKNKLEKLTKFINNEKISSKSKLGELKIAIFSYLSFLIRRDGFVQLLNQWETLENVPITKQEIKHKLEDWFRNWEVGDELKFTREIYDRIIKDPSFNENRLFTKEGVIREIEKVIKLDDWAFERSLSPRNIEFIFKGWDIDWDDS